MSSSRRGTPSSKSTITLVKKPPISKSKRAGVIFPVVRLRNKMKAGQYAKRIQVGGSVYLAGVLEYLTAEVMELAGNAARDYKRKRVIPRHILLAVKSDAELSSLLNDVTFSQGGVLPFIHTVLLPKRTQQKKSHGSEEM
ncbi:histone H2A, sperm-like [Bradysia coprophila]|uniref:histone H2A, sperm-like n=1 Tax=Bradysia coprophila TaxID=38358 RepID=UPI00187DA581|nr:histone H2A, sperm-like [Bradysia coprophila]